MQTGFRLAPWMDNAVLVVAVAFMLGGAVMIFTDTSPGIAFPLIAIGIALTVIVRAAKHRRHPTPSH